MTTKLQPDSSPAAAQFRKRAGFSLIEVMTAVMVLGLSIAGSLVTLQMAFGMVELSRDQTLASQFLQAEIETIRMKTWAEIAQMPAEQTFAIHGDFGADVAQRFSCVRRVMAPRQGVAVRRVIVEASWQTRNGVDRQLVYETRVSQQGINDYYVRSIAAYHK